MGLDLGIILRKTWIYWWRIALYYISVCKQRIHDLIWSWSMTLDDRPSPTFLQVLLPIMHEWLQILFWEPKISDHGSIFFKINDLLSDHGSWKKMIIVISGSGRFYRKRNCGWRHQCNCTKLLLTQKLRSGLHKKMKINTQPGFCLHTHRPEPNFRL